ncbi:MAG TPA: helix-turn-helix transcriptional regulator [Magnetospirillaceae bacterium]|nr:helix-turn-helix transcriptional regulator [Magnetospirillaceae bacterium]
MNEIVPHVGTLLREWRTTRRLSQLDLALEAGISARHLSYVETGKARPSRDMISLLADVLEMPLRERNALLTAAGFAARYRETTLSTPEMAPVRQAVDYILAHQDPYPALVMNRYWDLLAVNSSFTRLFSKFMPGPSRHANVLRQVFDPAEIRGAIVNWEEMAEDLIRHLHNQVAAAPSDRKSRALLDEILAYPGVPEGWRRRQPGQATLPLLTCIFKRDDLELRFFSTFTTFGTPWDVTVDELRIECMFPADQKTAELCRTITD